MKSSKENMKMKILNYFKTTKFKKIPSIFVDYSLSEKIKYEINF